MIIFTSMMLFEVEVDVKVLNICKGVFYGGSSPWSIKEYQFFPIFFLLLHCVPLYVCRLCINFQELCARLLGMATLRIRFSPSFHAL